MAEIKTELMVVLRSDGDFDYLITPEHTAKDVIRYIAKAAKLSLSEFQYLVADVFSDSSQEEV